MKQQIELTCAECGAKFTDEADYIVPGIDGYITKASGELVIFIDPTAEHKCTSCLWKAFDEFREASIGTKDCDDS